jgi:hypothetical protein
MEQIICIICHESPRVPVRLLFPCEERPGEMKCNSIQRYCLLCARRYLELNRPRAERSAVIKCPLCPATMNPRRLNASLGYEKDFLFMTLDTRNDIRCPYEDKGCKFGGTQTELHRHIVSECPHRKVYCDLCRMNYTASEEEDHKSECMGRVYCDVCEERIPRIDIDNHLREEHQVARCRDCSGIIFYDEEENIHMAQCPMRPIQCAHCNESNPAVEHRNHLISHMDRIQVHIQSLHQELSDRIRLLRRLTLEFASFHV